jgi:WD40 repeat protein
MDDPPGEPHHRHMAYDSANRQLFVANRARNRVEIFSTLDGSRVGSVDVAGASSVDFSADGKTALVGTTAEQIVSVDTSSLQRANTYQLSGILPIPNTLFDRPEEIVALSGGELLVRLRQADAAESLLALWNPANNTLTDLTSLAPQVFQNGVGILARSGDYSRVLVASNDGSATAEVLDGNAGVLTAAKSIGSGAVLYVAGSPDGSRFAAILSNGNI